MLLRVLQLLPLAAPGADAQLPDGVAEAGADVAEALAGVPAGTWAPVAPQLFAMLAGM